LLLWPFSTLAAADSLAPGYQDRAAYIIDACKEKHGQSSYLIAFCAGQIETLVWLASSGHLSDDARFCPPKDVTTGQARKIVIKYIEDRPDSLYDPFMPLAIDGLRDAWPCPKRGTSN
jgi:hypothetical protein